MPKGLSKRAIEGRRWRISAREKRKFNTVVSKYVEENHKEIEGGFCGGRCGRCT